MRLRVRGTLLVSLVSFLLAQLPAAVSAQPTFSVNDATMQEGDSGSTYTWLAVTRSPTGMSGSVRAATTIGGSATGGAACGGETDYVSVSSVVTFSATETTKAFRVEVCGDTRLEPNETILVTLTSPTGGTISDGRGQATIADNDSPRVRVGDVRQSEGNSGQTSFAVPVTLSRSINEEVRVTYSVDRLSTNSATEGTSCAGTVDFIGTGNLTLTFPANTTSRTINVAVCGDTASEPDESFTVVLSQATNAVIADNFGNVTIANDEVAGLPVLSIGDISWSEPDNSRGAGSVAVAMVPLRLSSASQSGATIAFTCVRGTATPSTQTSACSSGSDYYCHNGTIAFQAGSTEGKAIVVQICWDTLREGNETVQIRLSNPVGLSAPDTSATLTINDND